MAMSDIEMQALVFRVIRANSDTSLKNILEKLRNEVPEADKGAITKALSDLLKD